MSTAKLPTPALDLDNTRQTLSLLQKALWSICDSIVVELKQAYREGYWTGSRAFILSVKAQLGK